MSKDTPFNAISPFSIPGEQALIDSLRRLKLPNYIDYLSPADSAAMSLSKEELREFKVPLISERLTEDLMNRSAGYSLAFMRPGEATLTDYFLPDGYAGNPKYYPRDDIDTGRFYFVVDSEEVRINVKNGGEYVITADGHIKINGNGKVIISSNDDIIIDAAKRIFLGGNGDEQPINIKSIVTDTLVDLFNDHIHLTPWGKTSTVKETGYEANKGDCTSKKVKIVE
jgi:hypothetical protein